MPVVFGVEDATVSILKGAIEAVVALADHRMAETDPELGANLMVFFLRDWAELTATPNLDRLIPDLPETVARLEDARANQYRAFRFDEGGAIKAAFVFRAHGCRDGAGARRDHRAQPDRADDPLVVRHGFSRGLAAGGAASGRPRDPQAADCRPDPRGL